LDVFEAFAEKLRVAAVQTDVVLRSASRFEADGSASKRQWFLKQVILERLTPYL
jgi:hypothetical protein